MNIKFNQRNLKIAIAASVLVGSAGLTVPAYANGTSSSNMNVTSNIGMNCTISTTDIAFGAYDPIVTNASLDLDAQGSVTTTCTVGSAGKVIIGQGLGDNDDSTDGAPLRRMQGPSEGDYLEYQVYSNDGRSNVWTNEVATGVAYAASGSAQVMPVYGRVAAGQTTVAEGSYSDTLVVTVNY
mgnify:CR=1 FL=1